MYVGHKNYVYIRGLNSTSPSIPIKSRVYLYYTQATLAIWPEKWSRKGIFAKDGTTVQSWVDIQAPVIGTQSNGVGVSEPLVWIPESISAQDHYCLIAWADNSQAPQPPDLQSFCKEILNFDSLISFIAKHHNMGWRNVIVWDKPPQDNLYQHPFETKNSAGTVHVEVSWSDDLPKDGWIEISINALQHGVLFGPKELKECCGGYTCKVLLPVNYSTNVCIKYTPGPTQPPINSTFEVSAWLKVNTNLKQQLKSIYGARNLPTPLLVIDEEDWFCIGSISNILSFNDTCANV